VPTKQLWTVSAERLVDARERLGGAEFQLHAPHRMRKGRLRVIWVDADQARPVTAARDDLRRIFASAHTAAQPNTLTTPNMVSWPQLPPSDGADLAARRAAAQDACAYYGKAAPVVVQHLLQPDFLQRATRFSQLTLKEQWASTTQKGKWAAVRKFLNYVFAVGLLTTLADLLPRIQEEVLSHFATVRVLAGQAVGGVSTYCSHVRTWWFFRYGQEYGVSGGRRASLTSRTLKSLSSFFSVKASDEDVRREPITVPILHQFVRNAMRYDNTEMACLGITAFCGLFRVGELTATKGPFDPTKHVTEADAVFLPTFQQCQYVVIRQGRSKADYTGKKAREHPRIFRMTEDPLCPARWLQRLMVAKGRVTPGGVLNIHPTMPLFYDASKSSQLRQSAVLTFLRSSLRTAGYSEPRTKYYGTHSFRIGGATRLFALGAPIEIVKRVGGWSSDIWKVYLRVRRDDCLVWTDQMTAA